MDTTELNELTDQPELTVKIGGRDYDFGEIPIGDLAALDTWLRRHIPNPLDAIKPQLEGLPFDVQVELADRARLELASWPPRIGTAEGKRALLSSEDGQVEALRVGLLKFQRDTTPALAHKVYQQLTRDAAKAARRAKAAGKTLNGEGDISRIFSVMFGFGDPALEADSPKA